jgi:hypothetical protein
LIAILDPGYLGWHLLKIELSGRLNVAEALVQIDGGRHGTLGQLPRGLLQPRTLPRLLCVLGGRRLEDEKAELLQLESIS